MLVKCPNCGASYRADKVFYNAIFDLESYISQQCKHHYHVEHQKNKMLLHKTRKNLLGGALNKGKC
jgi:glycyl-tRNA synthetase (class II)